MPRGERSVSPESTSKARIPGPADYVTIQAQSSKQIRPLTNHKSFIMQNKHTIGQEERRTDKISIYCREYERDYSNKLGPGPAAYQPPQNKYMKVPIKGCSMGRAKRHLTSGQFGPGPTSYKTGGKILGMVRNVQPKPAFSKAHRTIDVIKCKSFINSSNLDGLPSREMKLHSLTLSLFCIVNSKNDELIKKGIH